jgi:hypothetical protein
VVIFFIVWWRSLSKKGLGHGIRDLNDFAVSLFGESQKRSILLWLIECKFRYRNVRARLTLSLIAGEPWLHQAASSQIAGGWYERSREIV